MHQSLNMVYIEGSRLAPTNDAVFNTALRYKPQHVQSYSAHNYVKLHIPVLMLTLM